MKTAYGYALSEIKTPFFPVVQYYGGFVCSKKSYLLMEYCDLGSLDSFVAGSVEGSLQLPSGQKSLIETLHYLRDHQLIAIQVVRREYLLSIFGQVVAAIIALQGLTDFISGDLKLANIFVTSKPISVIFNGLKLSAPFTCKIADYGKSSMTVDPNRWSPKDRSGRKTRMETRYRIYNYSAASSRTFRFTTPPAFNRTPEGTPYYVIPKAMMAANITPLAYIRHAGYPFYSSIDLYTMVVSMMLSPSFYYPVMTDPSLRSKLWDSLWFSDELDKITKSIHNAMLSGSRTSYRAVIPLLLDRKLRCNILSTYLENLKSLS